MKQFPGTALWSLEVVPVPSAASKLRKTTPRSFPALGSGGGGSWHQLLPGGAQGNLPPCTPRYAIGFM